MLTQNALRTGGGDFLLLKISTAVDVNEILKEVKIPFSLYKCAFISELSSNVSLNHPLSSL